MAGDGEIFDSVFFLGAGADVVDNEGAAVGGFLVTDDHDVGEVGRDGAGDEVAGKVCAVVIGFRDGEGGVVAFEEGHEVGDAAVIDVVVRIFQTPDFRVF